MPYFERKPYVSLLQDAVPEVPEQEPISQLARNVLAAETPSSQIIDGPFQCRGTCAPGSIGTILLSFAAPANGQPIEMRFEAGDLNGPDGAVLSAERVSVAPSQLRLEAGGSADVTISLRVHDLAEPGRYQGRVKGIGSEQTDIVVVFEVAEAN